MNGRIKDVRKSLNLTQVKFAERLGITQNYLTRVESGDRTPSDQLIRSIIREYGVNGVWLRTGVGDMFAPMTQQEELASAVGRLLRDDGDEYKRQLILAISDLQPETIKDIVKAIKQRFGQPDEK